MKPSPSLEPLFTAFQRINARAFTDDTLLSCPNLAKSPSYGDVLERYFGHLPPPDASFACSLLRLGRYVFAGFAHFMFLLLTRLFCIVQGWNLPPPLRENKKQHRVLIIDTFALIPKTAAQGHYTELYLPGLAGAAKHHYTVCHLFRLHGSRNPLALWRALKALKEKPCALTEAQLLRWNDWFKLLRHIAVYPLALHGLIVSLRNYSPGSPEAAIRDALTETAGQCVLSGEARRLAGYRLGLLCGAGNNASAPLPKIISWYENQTTNKTLNRGLHLAFRRTGKKIPVIGAQLFMWSTLFLNNYADDSEVARGLTPTVTAVNSPYFLPENSSQRYSVGPSLRYTHLFPDADTLQQNIKSGQGKPVLVLLSYHTGETRDILKAVRPLARHTPLAFRFHPATRPEDYLSYLPEKAPIENRPFQTALENASAVIGSGSGALVEAVCLGKPAVCLTLSEQTKVLGPSHFPLFGQGHLWETAALTENIFGVLTKLIRFQATGDYLNAVRSFRDLLFTKPTPEGILALLDLE